MDQRKLSRAPRFVGLGVMVFVPVAVGKAAGIGPLIPAWHPVYLKPHSGGRK